uniref:NR LBD domain-containing protein n=1 Tax=Tetranychus urticae TaxID=32264 RepID=T1K0F0_TETUR
MDDAWDYFAQQSAPPTETNTLLEESVEEMTSLPPFTSLSSSDLESILNSLLPGDETPQNHMDYGTGCTVNANNDCDIISSFNSIDQIEPFQEYNNQICLNNNTQNCENSNFTSSSSYDALDRFWFDSTDTSDASLQIETIFYSTHNSNYLMEPSDNSQRVQTWPSLLLRSGTHQKSIILPTIDPGFKPALSLCTDTSLVDEPWKPSVAKKILAAYYTPLSLKSELLATKAALNEFQSLAMQEAVMAFHDIAFHNNITIKQGRSNFPDVGPKTIVKACRRVKGFRRLLDDDKVTLLSSGLLDVMVLRSVLLYDHLTDSWSCSGSRFARNDVFQDLSLLIGLTRVIETFPDRWRKDLTVACLIYLIIIFNPDLPYLQFSGSIRL